MAEYLASRAGLLAVLLAICVAAHYRPRSHPMDAVPQSRIPIEEWFDDTAAVVRAATVRHFSIRGSPLGKSPCLSWDTQHLIASVGSEFIRVWRQGNASEFVLARGREAEFSRSRSVTQSHVTHSDFWTAAAGGSSSARTWLYHHGPVADWSPKLRSEAEDLESALSVRDAPTTANITRWPASSTNVWMGSSGTLATAHYDSSHNFVLQAFGRKEWLIWPPSELPALRLHPHFHPSRRQTRMQLLDPASPSSDPTAASMHPGYARTAAIRASVGAGELLYVPPYWAHAVLTSDPGVSLSTLSPSWHEATWARANWVRLPFSELPSPGAGRARATGLFLRALLPRVRALRGQSAAEFLLGVHAARHVPVRVAAGLGARDSGTEGRRGAAAADEGSTCTEQPAAGRVCDWLDGVKSAAALSAQLEEAAGAVAAVLEMEDGGGRRGSLPAPFPHRRFEDAVARELLAGFVEEQAARAVGEERASDALCCWAWWLAMVGGERVVS